MEDESSLAAQCACGRGLLLLQRRTRTWKRRRLEITDVNYGGVPPFFSDVTYGSVCADGSFFYVF